MTPGPAAADGFTPPNPDPDVHILLTGTTPVNGAQEALMGQTITATMSVSGTINSLTWTVSGSVFKTWSETTIPQKVGLTSADYTPTPPTPSLTFNDATDNDMVTVSCSGTYTDLSGETLPFNPPSQTVTFLKPKVTKWDIKTGYVQPYGAGGRLAADPTTSNPGGESWENVTIAPPPGSPPSFSGGTGTFAQLVTPDREDYTGTTPSPDPNVPNNKVQGLDGVFPYGDNWTLPGLGNDDDSPNLPPPPGNPNNYSKVTASDSFTTWVMYKPPANGSQGTIWVPLAKYTWSWAGTVSWLNSQWMLTSGTPADAGADPKYMSTNVSGADYPVWSITH